MLSQENRLRKRSDFDRLFKTGKSVGSKNLVFKYAQSPFHNEPSRIAFIVSNKTEKSAVKRNRVKRQLRAAVRELLPSLTEGYDGAFIVKPGLVTLEYQEKLKEVKQLLDKAGMLN